FSISIDNGDFSQQLPVSQLNLGAFQVNGGLYFERVHGVYQVAVRAATCPSFPCIIAPPSVRVANALSMNINTFEIRSNGTFEVNATADHVGSNEVGIYNASISLNKTGAGLDTFSMTI